MNPNDNQPTIEEIQAKLLEILLYFKKICDENNLKFTLAGGTCLGAVRHKGFIPWDDDVDVFMLREDYERLCEIWDSVADTERYACVRSNDKINIHHSSTEIQDKNTTFVVTRNLENDSNMGLMVDIIPLDGIPESKFARLVQMFNSMLYCCFNFQRLPAHKGKIVYLATKVALWLVRSDKLRYRLWKGAEDSFVKYGTKNCRLVASLGEGATIMRQRFPREWFENPEYLEFEGTSMPVPKDYDKWLTVSYGDYMQLPPEEDRVFRHEAVFTDLNNGYEKYKGIYFGPDRTNK